jgi:dTDP-4-amino-4,6-dideoxygalactose transaminase
MPRAETSHASGSRFGENPIGSCKYSDVTVLSFHPVKIFTTGEGGAILTNSKKIYERALLLRNQGIVRKKFNLNNSNFKPWFYDVSELGYNYRLTDIQSALGRSQLKKIDYFIKKRNEIANFYKKNLFKKIKFQKITEDCYSSYHLFIIRVPRAIRDDINKKLYKNKFITSLHYIPIYRHQLYKKFNFKKSYFTESENYYKEAISLPMHYNLNYKKLKKIISIVNSFFI